ncbi:MAG: hypothetical protein ACKVS9_18855 [Phycisphaerae bacterium]
MQTTRFSLCAAVPSACILLAGCVTAFLDGLPGDVTLPATAAYAAENAAQFKQLVDDRPASDAGTVVDSLSTLTGCWANVLVGRDGQLGSLTNVLRFDSTAGTYERIQFVGGVDGGLARQFPLISIDRGRFEIVDESSVRLTTETVLSNFSPDEPGFRAEADYSFEIGEPVAADHPATLNGDTLVIGFDDPNEATLIMRAFDCP